MQTTKGRIVIRVFRNMVPYTANNFLDLVSRGYYDGKSFHRVEGWVVQGGCPYGNGQGNYTDPDTGRERFLRLEINRNLNHNSAGVVAMARGEGSLDSASCQFYILKKPMSQLNGKYAVFGGVVDGLNNIYRIDAWRPYHLGPNRRRPGPESCQPRTKRTTGHANGGIG
jgi:peptidyl-prolyl cis-trans isomerase B (cyclophilin B)